MALVIFLTRFKSCLALASCLVLGMTSAAPAEERTGYPALFESAAREFDVPADVLKGVAFAETRWSHLVWAPGDVAACNGMPRPYGIMSLWDNEHFGHSLSEAARLIDQPVEVLKADVRQNIRGAAALLRRYYDNGSLPDGTTREDIESWRNAIADYCGIPREELAQQHALDVFSFINRGYHRHGIEWPGRRVRLESIRAAVRATRRGVAKLKEGTAERSIEPEEVVFQPAGQPDYPAASWRPAYPGHWYTSGNGRHFVVIHDMEGYYLSTISYFQRSNTQASAHYCINGLKDNASDAHAGEITQMVEERFYAWHARCLNTWSVGIEHEGFVDNPAWYTEEQYQASADLTRYLCDKYGIPKDRFHIVGHGEWQNPVWRAWMATNFPSIDPTCNNHTDPGPNWAWNHYMQLVTSGGSPAIMAQPVSVLRNPGETASLAVTATGTTPLRYQWLFEDELLANATNALLVISNVQISAAGAYSVWVGNSSGAVTSEVAYLTVTTPAAPVGTGSGLLAAYFEREDFSNPHFSRIDSTVNFDWGGSGPTVSMADDNFSIRWVGQVEPRYTQKYSFYVRSDDGARLWVNGQLLIDRLSPQPLTEWKGLADLEAGRRYPIQLDYFDHTGGAAAELSWSSASQVKQIIPRYQLHPPTLTMRSSQMLVSYQQPMASFPVIGLDPDPGAGSSLWKEDFESFQSGTANGVVLFRAPSFSGSTDQYLDGSTNYTTVTDSFPTGHAGGRVLKCSWSFGLQFPTPWLRLTTAAAAQIPNPTVDSRQWVQLDLWTDRPLHVALGIRESTNSAPVGGDGGVTGPIEFVGVTGVTGGAPQPVRSIGASNWVRVQFDLPADPVAGFTGDGVLAAGGGSTVLEHLALVPADGPGRYTIYVDNVQVVRANTITYSLVAPPAGVSVDALTGKLSWNLGEGPLPATNLVRVRMSNQVFPPMVMETNVVLVVLPTPAPSIRLVDNEGLECELQWDSIVGYTYQIQFKEFLGALVWNDLGLPVKTESRTAIFRDLIPVGASSRFYRVVPVGAVP
jgi:hypothetical protein